MAINVDDVYRTMLLVLNKQQRGYITPYEFSNTGTQVQLEIFEQYFEDLNQQLRVPQDDTEYADRVKNIDSKIAIFKTTANPSLSAANVFTQPTDLHRFGTLIYNDITEVQRTQKDKLLYINQSPLVKPTLTFPIYTYENDQVTVYPDTIISRISFAYVRKPALPRWGYSIGTLGQYIYDSNPYIADGLVIAPDSLIDSVSTPFGAGAINGIYTGLTDGAGFTYAGAGGGTGTGAVIDLTISGGVIANLSVTSAGSGYAVDDTFTFPAGTYGSQAIVTLVADDLYSGSTYGSTNFEIDDTEQTELILNMLTYSGIVIRDPQIIQTAQQLVMQDEANQKS